MLPKFWVICGFFHKTIFFSVLLSFSPGAVFRQSKTNIGNRELNVGTGLLIGLLIAGQS